MRTNLVRILHHSQVLPSWNCAQDQIRTVDIDSEHSHPVHLFPGISSIELEGLMMRKIRYCVAMSLDGYIAGPKGEADWIVIDPEMNFAELWAQFDTSLMGRRTYEAAMARLGGASMGRLKTIVVSRTLRQTDHPKATIVAEVTREWLESLRAQKGKDIWLFGGGQLFHLLLEMG